MRGHHPIRLAAAVLAVTATLGAAGAVTAFADSGPSPTPSSTPPCTGSSASVLACIKQRAAEAVANRETALQAMTAALDISTHVSAGDRTTLLGQISADETGLQALNAIIQADTTVAKAHTDTMDIVDNFRVYLLEAPKVHLVIASDTEGAAESLISSIEAQVQSAITNSTSSSKAAAQAAFDDCYQTQLPAATAASSGVSGEVIGLLPSGYPGNQPTLVSARQSVETARGDLTTCRTDLGTIRTDVGG